MCDRSRHCPVAGHLDHRHAHIATNPERYQESYAAHYSDLEAHCAVANSTAAAAFHTQSIHSVHGRPLVSVPEVVAPSLVQFVIVHQGGLVPRPSGQAATEEIDTRYPELS